MTTTAPSTWHGIETRRVLPAADLALVTRFGEALMDADRLNLELAATLHQIRWHHTEGVTVDTSTYPDEPPTGHRDPAGNAALVPDRSTADLRRMRRLLETAIAALDQAAAIAATYPTQAATLPDLEPTPGEDWCRCCWKHDKVCQPVTTRRDAFTDKIVVATKDAPAAARRIAVDGFRSMLADPEYRAINKYPLDAEIRSALAGHDLACWCPLDQPCHADVLLELANS